MNIWYTFCLRDMAASISSGVAFSGRGAAVVTVVVAFSSSSVVFAVVVDFVSVAADVPRELPLLLWFPPEKLPPLWLPPDDEPPLFPPE
jgi:hypothetical protein